MRALSVSVVGVREAGATEAERGPLERPPLQGSVVDTPSGGYRTCTGKAKCRKRRQEGRLRRSGAANGPQRRVSCEDLVGRSRSGVWRGCQLRIRRKTRAGTREVPKLQSPFLDRVQPGPQRDGRAGRRIGAQREGPGRWLRGVSSSVTARGSPRGPPCRAAFCRSAPDVMDVYRR